MSSIKRQETKLVPVPSVNKIPERDVDKSPILEAQHLGIDFGGLTAVNEFNMAIGRTEIAGLIGPNGAGKTTVFNLLTKVYQPTRGTVLLDGVDTHNMNTVQVNKAGIARTFQNIRLFNDLTVEENVTVAMDAQMKYNMVTAACSAAFSACPGTGRRRRPPMSARWSCSPFLTCRIWRASRRAPCPTAPSAGWRSSAPWVPTRPCFCWTSRRRA